MSEDAEAILSDVAAKAVWEDIDGGWSIEECRQTGNAVLAAIGLKRIGWMWNGEVHGDSTHAGCDPEPECVAVYAVTIGDAGADDVTSEEVGHSD